MDTAAQDRTGPETHAPGSEGRAEGSAQGISESQDIDFVTMGMFIIGMHFSLFCFHSCVSAHSPRSHPHKRYPH